MMTILLQGVIAGLFSGMVFSLWTGFGGPKPPPKYLPFSTSDCSAFPNVTRMVNSTAQVVAQKLTDSSDDSE
jgi:hypothetical protein